MSPVHYLDLSDYLAIAAEVTGLDTETIVTVTRLDLADSALPPTLAGARKISIPSSWTKLLSFSFG